MEKIKAGVRAFTALETRKKAIVCAALGLIVVLIVALCISIGIRANIQKDYAEVRNKIGESLYSDLYLLMQTFDMTTVPNADIQNAILPQMRDYYIASVALNNVLNLAYGPKYAVMTDSDIDSIKNAFIDYEVAYRDNTPIDLAQSNMQQCMDRVRELLGSRYNHGVLRPAR